MPSAWVDHHNAGEPRPLHVYRQIRPRVFEDATAEFAIPGIGALSVVCDDIDGDGELELVVANYRAGFEHDTDSFLYRRRGSGFAVDTPLRLPTHYAMQVALADLDGDGMREVIFAGGNEVRIFWNRGGRIAADACTVLPVEGTWTMFAEGACRVAAADVDGDGRDELLIAAQNGVQIRSTDALDQVRQLLPLTYCTWLHAADLDGDGRIDLIVSRREDGRSYDTESVVYWNGPEGFSEQRVTRLPTGGAIGCTAADLDGDGRPEVVFNNTMGGPSNNDPTSRCTSTRAARAARSTPRAGWNCPPAAPTPTSSPTSTRTAMRTWCAPLPAGCGCSTAALTACVPTATPTSLLPAGTCTTCRWATSTATAGSTCWRWPTPTITSPPPWPPRR